MSTIAAVAAIVLCGLLGWLLFIPTSGAMSGPEKFSIDEGQDLRSVARNLQAAGLIRNPDLFTVYLIALGSDTDIKAGTYTFPKNVSMVSIAYRITQGIGSSNDIIVTIPEGFNVWEIDARLADSGLITVGQFSKVYYIDEGKFFPDTYRFRIGDTIQQIATKMEDAFQNKTTKFLGGLFPDKRQKIIITASIIEKEARDAEDMKLVSGVIANRLKKGMNLEIDATVAYGACLNKFIAKPSKNCLVNQIGVGEEIRIDGPFNSYRNPGLPPSPISNPGLAAIEATLHPTGNYLYYLSTRDGSQMIFSRTSAEHAANRRKYLGL